VSSGYAGLGGGGVTVGARGTSVGVEGVDGDDGVAGVADGAGGKVARSTVGRSVLGARNDVGVASVRCTGAVGACGGVVLQATAPTSITIEAMEIRKSLI
jgi:hypothetical protein